MDPAEDGLPIPQRYWAILTLMVGVALSCLDTALVNVALPRIAKDLNSSPADAELFALRRRLVSPRYE